MVAFGRWSRCHHAKTAHAVAPVSSARSTDTPATTSHPTRTGRALPSWTSVQARRTSERISFNLFEEVNLLRPSVDFPQRLVTDLKVDSGAGDVGMPHQPLNAH